MWGLGIITGDVFEVRLGRPAAGGDDVTADRRSLRLTEGGRRREGVEKKSTRIIYLLVIEAYFLFYVFHFLFYQVSSSSSPFPICRMLRM